MTEPEPLAAIADEITALGDERHDDRFWDVTLDLTRDGILVMQRPETAAAMLRVQTNPRVGTQRYDLALGDSRWHRQRGAQAWPHVPLSAQDACVIGAGLRRLLPEPALEDLEPTGSVDPAELPVRLRIALSCNIARDLPWELLLDQHGEHVGLRGDVCVIRDLTRYYARPPLRGSGPLRVLVMVSSPRDSELNQDEELRTIEPQGRDIHVERWLSPNLATLRSTLERARPHVVHYVGHAGMSHRDGFVILDDSQEQRADAVDGDVEVEAQTQWVSASELAQALPASVRLLCLSTCVSRPNYEVRGLRRIAAAAAPLPTTVANLYAVSAAGAHAFWRAFYLVLADGDGDVAAATIAARCAAATAAPATADWASFGLWIRDGGPGLFDRIPATPRVVDADIVAHYMLRSANELASASTTLPSDVGAALLRESAGFARQAIQVRDDAVQADTRTAAPRSPRRLVPEFCRVGNREHWVGAGVLIHPRLVLTSASLGTIARVWIADETSTTCAWVPHPRRDVAAVVLAAGVLPPPAQLIAMPPSLDAVHFAKQGAVESMPRTTVFPYDLVHADKFGIVGPRVGRGIVGAPVYAGCGNSRGLIGLYARADCGVGEVVALPRVRSWLDEVAADHGIRLGGMS